MACSQPVEEPSATPRVVLACRLRAERRRSGFSQRELARRIGVDLRTIQRVEGAQVWPTESVVEGWLDACASRLVALVVEPVAELAAATDHR